MLIVLKIHSASKFVNTNSRNTFSNPHIFGQIHQLIVLQWYWDTNVKWKIEVVRMKQKVKGERERENKMSWQDKNDEWKEK
jgi:hypothetical protein